MFTRKGIARAARFAGELATARSGKLTSATKSNGIVHTMPFWDEVVRETLADFPAVELRSELIDASRPRSSSTPPSATTSSSRRTSSETSSPTSRAP